MGIVQTNPNPTMPNMSVQTYPNHILCLFIGLEVKLVRVRIAIGVGSSLQNFCVLVIHVIFPSFAFNSNPIL